MARGNRSSGAPQSLAKVVQNASTNNKTERIVIKLMANFILETVPLANLPYVFRYASTRIGTVKEEGEIILDAIAQGIIRRQPRFRAAVMAQLNIAKARYRDSLIRGDTSAFNEELKKLQASYEQQVDEDDLPAGLTDEEQQNSDSESE